MRMDNFYQLQKGVYQRDLVSRIGNISSLLTSLKEKIKEKEEVDDRRDLTSLKDGRRFKGT